ncbi:MAG: phosphatase PAP2 family protein [Magnetococcales bacterium]|nr:phosphatase PAP2 family protein [Magnetococcales bacterium]
MRTLPLAVVLLALVLLVAQTTDIDLWIQDGFFDPLSRTWLVDKEASTLAWIFYKGPKLAVVAVGVVLSIAWLLSFKKVFFTTYRARIGKLLLALMVVPGVISGTKNVTNVHCPWSLERYGGSVPHVPVFSRYPTDFHSERPGKCFPAGHPSGGFAFMMLFFIFQQKKHRLLGLGFGIASGWVLGIYQMLKGAHFFSHVVVSMLVAWILIESIHLLLASHPFARFAKWTGTSRDG